MSVVQTLIELRVKAAHAAGYLAVSLAKSGTADPETSYALSGRLYKSKSGWILLSVPSALVQGAFDALDEPGIELPPGKNGQPYRAHISVMRPEELEKVQGGADAISERGHSFRYTFGRLKTVEPLGWSEMSRCWFIEVHSPELQKLRKSYGLSTLPTKGDKELHFHCTVAVRRKGILYDNEVSKAAERVECDFELDLFDRVLGLKTAAILPQLAQVKRHSDARQWAAKHHLLQQLISQHPDDFFEDSREKGFVGVTHGPSGYRFHLPVSAAPQLKPRATDEAKGVPSKSDTGDLSKLQAGQLYDWVVQRHKATRAGDHRDYRIGSPDTGLYSWASRKDLPEPGQRHAWFQQGLHRHEYGDFEGEIPAGSYGAGTVSKQDKGKMLITKVSPGAIHFTLAHKKHPERFTLLKPAKWGEKDWLLVNNTPTEVAPYPKASYTRLPADQVEGALAVIQAGSSVQAKIDGASSLVKLLKDGVELVSYRTSKTTGRPIVHTERVLGGRPDLKIPPELVGSILRGEIYGEQSPTPGAEEVSGSQSTPQSDAQVATAVGAGGDHEKRLGRVIHPSELGGLLNSSVAKSLEDQRSRGIQLRNMLFDVAQVGKEPIDPEQVPYAKRREWLNKILPHLPQDRFEISPEVTTPADAQALWEQVRSGQHPLTREGIVIHPPTGRPTKAKLFEDADVHVSGIFPGEGKYQGTAAGGFDYSLEPGGPTVGRVGTGLSDDVRRDLWANQGDYVGRVAKIRSQEQLPSGAYRTPAFHSFHEDYTPKVAEYALSEWDDTTDPGEPLHRFDVHSEGKNVAYLTAHPETSGNGTWLKGMHVQPEHRGQGLARQLMDQALAKYQEKEMRLRARPYRDAPLSTEQLMAFYGKYGFEPYDDEGRMLRKPVKAAASLGNVPLQSQQERVRDRVEEGEDRLMLFHGLGSGKSRSAIEAAEATGEPYTAVMPASLRTNFAGEQAKWTDQKTPSQILSYNALASGAEVPDPGTLILDEAHRLRNPATQQVKSVQDLAARSKRLLMLSGSPVVNSPGDLAVPLGLLTGNQMTPRQFEDRYVGEKKVWPGFFPWLFGAEQGSAPAITNEDELEDRLRGHVDYFSPEKPPVSSEHERISTDMGPEQSNLYKAMWNKVPFWTRWKLQRNFPLSKAELKRLTSFLSGPRQVSLSTFPFMGTQDPIKAFEGSPKLQRAFEETQKTLANPQAKALVFSNFIDAGLKPYQARLNQAGISSGLFHGGLTDAQRQKLVNDYNTNKLKVMLLGPSGGEGLSFKGTQLIQLLDPHWNESRGRQQQGRGIRFDSHRDLPPELQNVRVQRYISTMPPTWWEGLKDLLGGEHDPRAAESYLEEMSAKKEEQNVLFTDLLKRVGSERPLKTAG